MTAPADEGIVSACPVLHAEVQALLDGERLAKVVDHRRAAAHAFADHAFYLAQVALQAATGEAYGNAGAGGEWAEIAKQAERARRVIGDLLHALDTERDDEVAIGHVITQAARGGDWQQAQDEAQAFARALVIVRDGAARLAPRAEQLASDLKRGRGQPRDAGQGAFAKVMFEAWATLTGTPPGASKDPANNPSLRFAQAAYADWLGTKAWALRTEDTGWAGALMHAHIAQVGITKGLAAAFSRGGPPWAYEPPKIDAEEIAEQISSYLRNLVTDPG